MRICRNVFIIFCVILTFCCVLGFGIMMASNADKTVTTFNVSEDENNKTKEILKECGIEELNQVERDELLDHDGLLGYRAVCERGKLIIYFDEEKLRQVKYVDNYLYQNQKVIDNIKNYTFTLDEKSDYQIKCQYAIKDMLKSPSSAKFPNINEWGFNKDNGIATIIGYVDSQNGFGTMIRSEFQFKIRESNNSVVSLIFDGVEYIK